MSAGVRIERYTPDHAPAVRAFNARLATRGIRYRFPDEPPDATPARVFQTGHVAIDRHGAVRGGYMVKLQEFIVNGERRRIGFYRLPLSEGIIDRRFGIVGMQLLADATKRHPELFVLGIGSFSEPLARMVQNRGWLLQALPFYFHVVRPFRFARGIRHLRRTRLKRLALDAAAFSGLAWAGAAVARTRGVARRSHGASHVPVERFGAGADAVWSAAQSHYALIAVRDAETLNLLYPADDPRFLRIEVRHRNTPVGWAVLLDTQMKDHAYFGGLRVGSIVDCLAVPGWEMAVASRARFTLRRRGVDLIVSNQAAHCWREALRAEGFLEGPSGFLFGPSPALAGRLPAAHTSLLRLHLNRGDGDGPIHL